MSSTIYRYPVKLVDEQTIAMPEGAKILKVARREGMRMTYDTALHESIDLWAAVDNEKPLKARQIRVVGTGNPMPNPERLCHLGTVQIAGGKLVFHIFEEIGTSVGDAVE